MRKGWRSYSIVTGIAASLVAYLMISLTFGIAARQSQLFNLLYQMGGDAAAIPYFRYEVSNGAFVLLMVGMLALEFSVGMLSCLLARNSPGNGDEGLKASIVAGLLPALTFGILHLNSWQTGLAQNNTDTFAHPADPGLPGMAIGIVLVLMLVCLASAMVGGMMARYALKRNSKGGVDDGHK